MEIPTIPLASLINLGVLVLTLFSWAGIHGSLDEKEITISQSRVWWLEFIPAVSFSALVVYYLLPATYNLLLGKMPAYASNGFFWDLAMFIGAIGLCVSTVGWIGLIPESEDADNESEQSEVASDDSANSIHSQDTHLTE